MINARLHIEVNDTESGTTEDFSLDAAEGSVQIGRDRNSHIVLTSPSVSRRHCVLEPDDDGWVAIDSSSLGTRLNETPLVKGERKRLQHGDVLGVAHYDLKLSVVALTDPTLKPDPMALKRLMDEVGGEKVHPSVWVFIPGMKPKEYDLVEEGSSLTIGRSAECNVVLPDPMRVVSSFHAKIERSWAGVFLYDTSTNGIFVNGEKVEDGVALSDGDRVTVAVPEEEDARPLLVFTGEGNSSTPEGPGRAPGVAGSAGQAASGAEAGAAGGAGGRSPSGSAASAASRADAGSGGARGPEGRGSDGKRRDGKRPSNVIADPDEDEPPRKRSVLAEVQRAIQDVEQEEAKQEPAAAESAGGDAGPAVRRGTGATQAGGPDRVSTAAGQSASGHSTGTGGKSNLLFIAALVISGLALIIVVIWAIVLLG